MSDAALFRFSDTVILNADNVISVERIDERIRVDLRDGNTHTVSFPTEEEAMISFDEMFTFGD